MLAQSVVLQMKGDANRIIADLVRVLVFAVVLAIVNEERFARTCPVNQNWTPESDVQRPKF